MSTGRGCLVVGGAALLAGSLVACGSTPQRIAGPVKSSSFTSHAPHALATQGARSELVPGTVAAQPPVSVRTVRVLRKQGTDVTVVPTDSSSKRAVAVARGGFGSLRDEAPIGVSLARVTVHDYGTRHPGDPERLDLIIEDRLVWVVFDGFTQQPGGPIPSSEPSATAFEPPPSARLVSFVDAHTYEWLSAETV